MKIIGVVGGIASGKSHVAQILEHLGARRIDGDQLGHQVLDAPEVQRQLTQRWGDSIVVDGRANRRAISEIVFQTPTELKFLEQTTHPRIQELIEEEISHARQAGENVVIVDAAVMLKAQWAEHCGQILFVDAPRELRQTRALKRGWTREQFEAREAAQLPVEQKRQRAHLVINNSGTLEETFDQVKRLWDVELNVSS